MRLQSRLLFAFAAVAFIGPIAFAVFELGFEHPIFLSTTPAEEKSVALEEFSEVLIYCFVPGLVVAALFSWWLSRRLLQPMQRLAQAFQEVQESNLRHEVPRSHNGDELDRMTNLFNDMVKRLDGSFQQVRNFTLHASHELKTPLTIMHMSKETALRTKGLSPEERRNLEEEMSELVRLSKIVDGLSLLTKADAGLINLEQKPVRLNELVAEAASDAEVLGEARGLKVEVGQLPALTVQGDQHRLRQLLLNLVDNAVKYSEANGLITVSLSADGERAEMKISNRGQPIPQEMQESVFNRFIRVPQQGNAIPIEGSGLGLAIARWLAEAHGGTLTLNSTVDGLITLTLTLPVSSSEVVGVHQSKIF